MKNLRLKLAVVALSLTALSGSAYAGSEHAGTIQAGTLICELRGKTNLILYSKRKFDCRFDPAGSRAVESYGGEITNIGVDLEVTKTGSSGWCLLPPPTFRRELWREATSAAARRSPSAWVSGREQ